MSSFVSSRHRHVVRFSSTSQLFVGHTVDKGRVAASEQTTGETCLSREVWGCCQKLRRRANFLVSYAERCDVKNANSADDRACLVENCSAIVDFMS